MKLRKALSIILAVCMVLSSVSVAYAGEIPEITETKIEGVEETVTEAQEVEVKTESIEEIEEAITEDQEVEAEAESAEEKSEAEEANADAGTDDNEVDINKIQLKAELEDVTVTLDADADAFDNKGELSLSVTPVEITDEEEKKLDGKETENVAKRVTYDITVLDDGEEIEPVKEVTVSFELKDAPSGADGVNIYHHDEDEGIEKIATEVLKEGAAEETVSVGEAKEETATEKNIEITEVLEEELADTDDVEIENDVTVEATTDSFSLYTIDFTYEDKTISIAGDTTGNKLDDIVSQLGIEEKVEEATAYQNEECTVEAKGNEVKNTAGDTLFTVYESGDTWYVDAENAFQTEHGLVIKTADGAEYKIKVTDAALSGTPLSGNIGTDYILSTGDYYLSGDVTGNIIIEYDNTVTLDLNGFVLRRTSTGSVINNSGTLTIKDSNTGNQTHKFIVNGEGLWILNETDGTESISGGVITGGNAQKGGGVFNSYTGTIIMNGGSITGNTATSDSGTAFGGGVYSYGINFTMNGGSITGNTATSDSGDASGGGVRTNTDFTMRGGSITGNTATSNSGSAYGGGVSDTDEFTMRGGSITGNTATSNSGHAYGGGVDAQGSTFTMNGGSITGNTATDNSGIAIGGGVNCYTEFTMNGGSITGNTAAICGGVSSSGSNILGGTAVVVDNTATNIGSNFVVYNIPPYSVTLINISTEKIPATGMNVGITILDSSINSIDGNFTSNGSETDKKYFFSDDTKYAVKYVSDHLELVSGKEIQVASCVNGSASIGNQKSAYKGETVTVTATPDAGYTLDTIKVYKTGEEATTVPVTDSKFTMPDYPVTISATFKKISQQTSGGSSSGSSSYTTGWHQSGTNWQYVKPDGSYARNEWLQIELNGEKKWYHFGNDTMMDTGWFLDTDGSWYYLNKENNQYIGTMYIGWLTDPQDGYRYYLDPATGKMHTGWHVVDGKKHYFNETVPSASGWTQDAEGNWVYDKRSVIPLGAMLQ